MAIREEVRNLSWQHLMMRETNRSSQGQRLSESRGMEYRESRAYVVGDDYRSIDWRAMARSGEAYTKIFSDQQEQSATLAIDLSPSMFFGTRYSFKSWTAIRLAAIITWLCERSQLSLNCLISSQEGLLRIPLASARRNLPQLFSTLSRLSDHSLPFSDQKHGLNSLLARSGDALKPGGMFLLLSDCLGVDEDSNRLLGNISRHNKTAVFRINDQSEILSWPSGSYSLKLKDEHFLYHHSPGKRSTALQQVQSAVDKRVSAFSSIAASQLQLSCNQDLLEQLRNQQASGYDAG